MKENIVLFAERASVTLKHDVVIFIIKSVWKWQMKKISLLFAHIVQEIFP